MRLLRGLLVTFAWIIFFGNLFVSTIKILQTNLQEGVTTFFFQEVSYFFLVLPIPALMIWAAYNLGSSAFPANFVKWILKTSLWLVLAGTIVLIAQLIAAYAPYFPNFEHIGLKDIVQNLMYYIYSFGEILLLTFALRQLSHSLTGKQLTHDTVNTSPNIVSKIRNLGDKTDPQEK